MIIVGEKSKYYFEGVTKTGTPIRIYVTEELAREMAREFSAYAKRKQQKIKTCSICGCDPSEHNWEIHAAEMKAGY